MKEKEVNLMTIDIEAIENIPLSDEQISILQKPLQIC